MSEENIDWRFDMSCAHRYNMDSDDVDAALAAAGLTRNCTIEEAENAVRKYAVDHYYLQVQVLPPWI